MTHEFDPSQLRDNPQYCAALDELENLMLVSPGTPAGLRYDGLVRLVKDYETRRDGHNLDRMEREPAPDRSR